MVVKLRSAVGVTMIWLVVVAGTSATASVAIDRVGRDVAGAGVGSLRPMTVDTPVVTTTAGSLASPTSPTPEPSTQAPIPTRASTPAQSRPSPTTQLSPRTGSPPRPSPVSPRTGLPPRPSPVSPRTGLSRTANVVGGQVTVACTGETIVLRIAQPQDGWRVDVGQSGPAGAQVQVFFRRGDADASARTEVRAVCAEGTPAFTVEDKN